MRFIRAIWAPMVCCAALTQASPLRADTTPEERTASPLGRTTKSRVTKKNVVAKDPENRRGISPFWEKVVQGDTAAIAHDYLMAMSYYQSALTSDPKNPVGHLRLAEVAIKQNELDRVPEYLDAAFRFAQGDLAITLKVLFLTAMMHEQKGSVDEAIAVWQKYKDKALEAEAAAKEAPEGAVPPPARVYTVTADLRVAALTQYKQSKAANDEVKARIQKNVDAADQALGVTPASK